jgi:5-hydroxyisourate hydrolase-like protein (transthyretin family)
VFVHVSSTAGGAVPGCKIFFVKPGGRVEDIDSADTDATGTAIFEGTFSPGKWEIETYRQYRGLFESAKTVLVITPRQSEYQVALALQPTANSSWARRGVDTSNSPRNLLIRVEGRMANGRLVPVQYAIVKNQRGDYITTTDAEGLAYAQHSLPLGEMMEVRAEAPPRGYQHALWRPGTGSFIVGASEGGTRITRTDDYVNIVLEREAGSSETAGTHPITIRVQGRMPNGELVPVHYATIYDEHDKKIVMTGYDGTGQGVVADLPTGETYKLHAEANHWKTGVEAVSAGAHESSNMTSAQDYVTFVLEPEQPPTTLTIRVLDHQSDAPVAGAHVTLLKRVGFPGKPAASATTDSEGYAKFDEEAIASARSSGDPRVSASAASYSKSVQDLGSSIFARSDANYLLYLKRNSRAIDWSGTYSNNAQTLVISGSGSSFTAKIQWTQPGSTHETQGSDESWSCEAQGSQADCTGSGSYWDGDKTITLTSKNRLTLSGKSLAIREHIVTANCAAKKAPSCDRLGYTPTVQAGADFTSTVAKP